MPEGRRIFNAIEGMTAGEPDERERARLTALLESLPSAAALFAPNGTLAALNTAAREFLVVDDRAPLGSQHWNVVLQPLGDVAIRAIDAARARTPVLTHTIPLIGSARLVDLRVTIFDSNLLLVSLVDATEREANRQALETAERERAALFALSAGAVRVVDLDGRIVRRNPAAVREDGETVPPTIRALWEREQPVDTQTRAPLAFLDLPAMRAFAGRVVTGQRLRVRRGTDADGMAIHREIASHAAPITDASGRVLGVMVIDEMVADAARVSQPPTASATASATVTAETHDAAERAARLELMSRLAAGIIHDLNNALNPIMSAAFLLRHHAHSPDTVREYASRIETAAERGTATASRVGRFIRQEPLHDGGAEPIDLSALAASVLDAFAPLRAARAAEGHPVTIVRQFAGLVPTRGVADDLSAALHGIVTNAFEAMPSGGTLTVRTETDGRHARVSVGDTGSGMSAEVRAHAFEPFFSTKASRGAGLGLAEAYGVAKRHRGDVTLTSIQGRGTEVTLRLPAAPPPMPASPTPTSAVEGGQRVLIVEDDDDGREFLRRVLRMDGHEVAAVSTCAEARARLVDEGGSLYDVMLTDVGLPDGSGWELVQQARVLAPTLRIGVITGWDPDVGTIEASAAEFVLRKPLRVTELRAHIAGRHSPSTTNE